MSAPFKLTKRLQFLLEQLEVPVTDPSSSAESGPIPELWDIGCDHGLLGLAAVATGRVSKAHLVDPSPRVIESLKATLNSPKYLHWWKSNEARVRFLLSNGEEVVVQTSGAVVIAGMGGETMVSILRRVERFDVLVLNPLSHFEELEEHLAQRSWKIKNASIKDRGIEYRIYTVTA